MEDGVWVSDDGMKEERNTGTGSRVFLIVSGLEDDGGGGNCRQD